MVQMLFCHTWLILCRADDMCRDGCKCMDFTKITGGSLVKVLLLISVLADAMGVHLGFLCCGTLQVCPRNQRVGRRACEHKVDAVGEQGMVDL